MSISSRKFVVSLVAAAVTLASAGALAQDKYNQVPYDQNPYDQGRDDRPPYSQGEYDNGGGYDYARVVDVQPLTTRVRVTTPQRECWDETRYDQRGYNSNSPLPRSSAGGAVLGGIVGAVIGHQIGHGRGRDAATAAGAVIGAAVGSQQAQRRAAYGSVPPREYTVQRCETRYRDEWQERTDAYRVTYVYNGRRQVTELPYRPGDRIRVRVDVSPAE
ncbi:MAG TPA: glycine zipper 2TM domain-containing protein [Steroidobacteraceae bacterium]|nr:glycine zipper 2TM domain-containing protein [Steroidobacteraceae bacterium]